MFYTNLHNLLICISFFYGASPSEIYTLSLHDALPILRWKLVIALSALGGIDEAGIDEFLTADDTQSGRKSALTARAALPTAEAKARAWRLTVEQDVLANESVTAVVQGFRRVTDPSLLDAYRERYFSVIDRIWAERSTEIAGRIVQGYFPNLYGGPQVIEDADTWLAEREDTPVGLRRVVIEGRDTVARQERIRQADVPEPPA